VGLGGRATSTNISRAHNSHVPDFVSFASGELSQDDAYNVLVAAISPRPIALVSTLSTEGIPNLAPFSFFMAGGVSPLSLAFSPTDGAYGPKDSLRNIVDTGEFVVNTVHRAMADGMNKSSAGFGSKISEWEASGFAQVPSVNVRPARVGESLVQLECKLFQVVRHGEGSGAANYVIGEVVRMHINQSVWNESGLRLDRVRLLSRLGGPEFLDAAGLEIFELQRPGAPVPEEE
jgi:flavin reductase (DIM6/NTAB) family NADH-FMN oxidoreductase RutF